MPPTIVDAKIFRTGANQTSVSQAFDVQPAAGTIWLVAGGAYWDEGGSTWTYSDPSGLTSRLFGNPTLAIIGRLSDKISTGSDGVTSTGVKTGTGRSLALAAVNIADVLAVQTTGLAAPAFGSYLSLLVETDENVAEDGSLAIAIFLRQSRNEGGAMAYTYSNGFEEVGKAQNLTANSQTEIYVAKKIVNAGAKAACTWSTSDGTATNMQGFIVVYPPDAQPVSLAVPSAQEMVKGVWRTLPGLSVTASNPVDITLACTHGILSVPDAASAGVTVVSGDGTSTLVVSGTVSQFDALFAQAAPNGVRYRQDGYEADTITVDAEDTGATTADQKTIAVHMVTARVVAPDQAALNATLASLTWTPDAAGDHVALLRASGVEVEASVLTPQAITVSPSDPPIANAGPAQSVWTDRVTQLDGSGSTSPSGQPLTYQWTLTVQPDGSEAVLSDAETVSPSLTPDAPGQYVVSVVVHDGLQSSDPASVIITAAVSVPPVVAVPASMTVTAGVTVEVPNVSVADDNQDLVQVRMRAMQGVVGVTLQGLASISAGANDTADFTLSGSHLDLINTVATLRYRAPSTYAGADTITVTATDSDSGQDEGAIAVTVEAPIPAPTITAPQGQTVFLGIPSVIGGLLVADVNDLLLAARLTVTQGILTVVLAGDATISAGANGSVTLTVSGSQADINATLATVIYTSGDVLGDVPFTLTATNTADKSTTRVLTVTVVPVPALAVPVILVPSPVVAVSGVEAALPSLQVQDADGDLAMVDVRVVHGILRLSLSSAITVTAGSNGSGHVRIEGAQAAIQSVLVTLTYTSPDGFLGVDTVTVLAVDAIGLSAQATLPLIVNPPPGSGPVAPEVQALLDRLLANTGRLYGG